MQGRIKNQTNENLKVKRQRVRECACCESEPEKWARQNTEDPGFVLSIAWLYDRETG